MPRLGVDPATEDVAKMRCNDVTFGAVQSDSVEHFGNFSPNETYILDLTQEEVWRGSLRLYLSW